MESIEEEMVSFDTEYSPQPIVFTAAHSLQFRIPLAPVSWQRPRFNGKRAFTAPKVAEFKQKFLALLAARVPIKPLWDGPVSLDLHFRFPRPAAANGRVFPIGKPDIDNNCKCVMDICNEYIWKDDCQIVALSATKSWADVPCEIGIEITARQICSRIENERKNPSAPRKSRKASTPKE